MSTPYYARVYYTGNGAQTLFAIPFPYIYQADVYLYQNGTLDTTTVVTWTGTSQVNLNPAPLSGSQVEFVRQTVETSMLAVIQAGTISPTDINLDTTQLLYLIQELTDDYTYEANVIAAELAAVQALLTGLSASGTAAILAAIAALGTPLVVTGGPVTSGQMAGIGILVVNQSSPIAINISLASGVVQPYRVVIADGGDNAALGPFTVSSPDGYKINGLSTYVINNNGQASTFIFVNATYGFIAFKGA